MAEYGPSILARVAVHNPWPFTFTAAMAQTQPTGLDRWAISFLNELNIRDGLYCPHGTWMAVYVFR